MSGQPTGLLSGPAGPAATSWQASVPSRGGEIDEYAELAHQARRQALDRLAEHARSLGANAVISVMLDSTEMSNIMEEIIAFGTAVIVSPADEAQQLVKLRLWKDLD